MTRENHPFEGEDWVVQPGPAEYYASKQKSNWIILACIVVFVFAVMGLVMWKWDRGEFYRVVAEREGLEAANDAQREAYESVQETVAGQE